MSKMKIVEPSSGDWYGVYVGGALIREGRTYGLEQYTDDLINHKVDPDDVEFWYGPPADLLLDGSYMYWTLDAAREAAGGIFE